MDDLDSIEKGSIESINKRNVIMKTDDLIQVIYKLKHRFNDLQQIRDTNYKILDQKRVEEFSYMRLISNPQSEPSSNISTIENNNTNSKQEELKKKKQLLERSLANEIESNSKINFMIGQEKENLLFMNEKLVEINEKVKLLNSAKKELINNENEAIKKNKNGKNIMSHLSNEVSRLRHLINNQDQKLNVITNEIETKKGLIDRKKQEVNNLVKNLEKKTKINKEIIKKDIQEIKTMKETKRTKENYYVKIILGLDLIKNYILNKKDNKENIFSNDDYKTFKCEKLLFFEDNLEQTNNPIHKQFTLTSKNSVVIKEEKEINLNILKDKYDNLDITYEELYDFYSKMMNKQLFNHNYMMKYNDKQVQLEIKREKYSNKVKELISKNYKNFDELIKSNSKLENFINKFNHSIKTENSTHKIYKFDLDNRNDRDFSKRCNVLFSEINSTLDFLYSNIEEHDRLYQDSFDEDDSYLKLLKDNSKKIKIYFQNISKKINSDMYLELLFSDYLIPNNKIVLDCEKKIDFDEKINDSNKDRLFLDLKNFIAKEKHLFYAIDLSFEKDLFIKLNQSNRLVEILSSIKEINSSYQLILNPPSSRQNINIDLIVPKKLKKNPTNKINLLHNDKEISEDSIHEEKQQTISVTSNHKKYNSISVAQSLYEPFIKKKYVKELSENFQEIKKNTVQNIKGNFFLNKKQGEIKKMTNEILLYNNPSKLKYKIEINLDNLSKNTYNDIMKKVILNKKTLY